MLVTDGFPIPVQNSNNIPKNLFLSLQQMAEFATIINFMQKLSASIFTHDLFLSIIFDKMCLKHKMLTVLNPVCSEFDKTKKCFSMTNIGFSIHVEITDADFVSLFKIEKTGCVTHHLHLHSSMFLTPKL